MGHFWELLKNWAFQGHFEWLKLFGSEEVFKEENQLKSAQFWNGFPNDTWGERCNWKGSEEEKIMKSKFDLMFNRADRESASDTEKNLGCLWDAEVAQLMDGRADRSTNGWTTGLNSKNIDVRKLNDKVNEEDMLKLKRPEGIQQSNDVRGEETQFQLTLIDNV